MHISGRRVTNNFSVPKRVLERLRSDSLLNVTYADNKFYDDSKIKRNILVKTYVLYYTTDERKYKMYVIIIKD